MSLSTARGIRLHADRVSAGRRLLDATLPAHGTVKRSSPTGAIAVSAR
jgi:hypothetical protein